MHNIIYPKPLQQGDKIAILSPASIINPDYVKDAINVLTQQGWEPYVATNTLGKSGNYSGTITQRFEDLKTALLDSEVRAIMCSRGGYGVVHLLEELAKLPIADDPKWIIGFSDISALHALMTSKGIASIHASMTKHLSEFSGKDEDAQMLFNILRGEMPVYKFPYNSANKIGQTSGRIIGGNLAVLAQLIRTPFDIFEKDTVLFIEDICEPIYKVERILYQLKLAGILGNLKGLIVGQFTEYSPDTNYDNMNKMITDMIAPYSYPVVFDAPIGHVDHNIPIIENAQIELSVAETGTTLIFKK